MKPTIQIMLSAFLLLFSFSAKAQEKNDIKDIKKTFYYSFENVTSPAQIETLKQNVSFLKGVTEVKSEYKPEKAAGQIMVVVIERKRRSESDQEFDIVSLKNAILQSQLTPLELTQEESIIEN